jgi:hypothetical protein
MPLKAKFSLLILGLFAGLALVEIVPRALASLLPSNVSGLERVYAGRAKWEEMMVADADLGYHPKPDLDLLYPSEGRSIVVRTTSHGLGDIGFRDIDTEPPFDAIALGDSFTFCDDVPVKECWVRLLGEQAGLSIASLGISGFSTMAEARVLRQYGKRLLPKIVLLGLFPNDFNDNLRFAEWIDSGHPDFWEWRKAREGRGPVRSWLASHSLSYRLLDAALRSGDDESFRYDRNGLSLILRTGRWVADEEQERDRQEGWRLMREALLDIERVAASIGAELVVVLIPSKEEVYWNVVRRDLPSVTLDDIDRPLGLVEEFCQQNQIPVCDLRPPFEREAELYRQLYLRVSGHWTDAGNVLAAETITECLRTHALLPQPLKETARQAPEPSTDFEVK